MTANPFAYLLKDVPRQPSGNSDPHKVYLLEAEVLAALTAALDGVEERAGEVLERLKRRDKSRHGYTGHPLFNRDGLQAADLITALLAQNAALRAEVEWWKQDSAAWDKCEKRRIAQEAAEAKVEKLRAALMVARAHVANNAEGWSVSRGAARDDLTIVDAALTTEKPHE